MDIEIKEQINQLDSQGRRHGLWRVFDPNGELMYEGSYINGDRNGWWKYYDHGLLWIEADFFKDKVQGISKVYVLGCLIICYHNEGYRQGESIEYEY